MGSEILLLKQTYGTTSYFTFVYCCICTICFLKYVCILEESIDIATDPKGMK